MIDLELQKRLQAIEGQQAALGTTCAMLMVEVARLSVDQQLKLDTMSARLRSLADISAKSRPRAVSAQALTAFVEGTVAMAEKLLPGQPADP